MNINQFSVQLGLIPCLRKHKSVAGTPEVTMESTEGNQNASEPGTAQDKMAKLQELANRKRREQVGFRYFFTPLRIFLFSLPLSGSTGRSTGSRA